MENVGGLSFRFFRFSEFKMCKIVFGNLNQALVSVRGKLGLASGGSSGVRSCR